MNFYNSARSLPFYILFYSFLVITSSFPRGIALSFKLNNISSQNLNVDIIVDPDAYISTQGIQLTSNENGVNPQQKAGRAMYIKPLHLWDRASGNLTDFDTHFSFVIDRDGGEIGGDGLAFFLIQPGESNNTVGGAMGLPLDPYTYHNTSPFVAVEFDTFSLGSNTTHVGIDVNTIKSSASIVWESNLTYAIENEAWVSYNSFSKNLSVVFTGSINSTMILQHLHFVVDLRDYLPEWVMIGFSASTGAISQRHTIKSWQFHSTLNFDDKSSLKPIPDGITPANKKGRSNRMGLIVGFTVSLFFLVFGFALMGTFWCKTLIREHNHGFSIKVSMEKDFQKNSGSKNILYVELARATNNLDEAEKLGEGGFGGVYRGFLIELNSYIAVKRISKGSKQRIKEYAAEVRIIGRLRHKNLVRLIGWCHEKRELLLVYEFLANATLDTHLYKDKSFLTWEKRYKIAKSLASALLYLHEEGEQCVVHRDVKPSNVMLDLNFNAKLGDFGLARLVDHEKCSNQTTVLAGTMGYMAPESIINNKASKESDVYSFEIVALEIACGRKPVDTSVIQESHVMLVEFVWDLYGQENLLGGVDSKLGSVFDKDEMKRLMTVGLWCAHPDPKLRPSIRQAIHVLNFEGPVPILPGKMPVANYISLPKITLLSLLSKNSSRSMVSPDSLTLSSSYKDTYSSKVSTY